jgi:hypothetical protein
MDQMKNMSLSFGGQGQGAGKGSTDPHTAAAVGRYSNSHSGLQVRSIFVWP